MKPSEQTIALKRIAAVLLFALGSMGVGNAQLVSGELGAVVDPLTTSTSSFSATSFNLSSLNLVSHEETGTFLTLVPPNGDFTALTQLFTGLSIVPKTESVNDFFEFSSPDSLLGSSGTTPSDRFDFDLSSLAETSYTGRTASFVGTGTIIDTAGVFSTTPADVDISFSSQGGYTLLVETEAVPEPSTYALMLGGIAMLAVWGRRRLQA